jgi:hypothetical protein
MLLVHRLKRHWSGVQRGPGTDLSWEELEVLVKGITGESFVLESLILPEDIPALCDDAGLRSVNLATLPTLDERGIAVRQTGGQDPHRGIQISDAPVGGPQTTGVAPSAPTGASHVPVAAPRPLDKGKGAASSFSAPGGTRMLEEERRRRLRRADGSFVLNPPLGSRRSAPKSIRGPLVGAEESGSQAQGAPVLCHHSHWVHRHHNHHHCRARRRQQHQGVVSPRGASSSNNNSSSRNSGRPASRVAGRSRAPSEWNPFLFD